MNITTHVEVPGSKRRLRVLVRSPAWVSESCRGSAFLGEGLHAWAWYQPHPRGKVFVGTIAINHVDLGLVAHEVTHCAHDVLGRGASEEEMCTFIGVLTKRVWKALV